MSRLTSFTDAEPARPRPEFDLEVRGLACTFVVRQVGVYRDDTLLAKVHNGVASLKIEIFGESGSTEHTVRLRPYYHSWLASHLMRSVPMMEMSGDRKPLASFWLHDQPFASRPDCASYQFRLLPRDYSPKRAHDLEGNLLVRAHSAWRDSDVERKILLGIEVVNERDPVETLLGTLGLTLLSNEMYRYSKFGV